MKKIAIIMESWNRYFTYAWPSGMLNRINELGEDINLYIFNCSGNWKGIPNNLLPYVAQVAIGKLECVGVFGDDYDTPDGTGVRDYIHVVDLALGHVKALDKIKENPGVKVYNLGTGNGYSVLDVIKAFSKACGHDVPYQIKPRRPGDIATCYSDASLAKKELNWEAKFGIEEMCADSWNWQSKNPNGYNE